MKRDDSEHITAEVRKGMSRHVQGWVDVWIPPIVFAAENYSV